MKCAVRILPCAVLLLLGCEQPSPLQKSLRIGLETDPVTLDPHLNGESATWTVLGNMFEGLVGFDRNMKVIPLLAERWENPDDLTWVFHLRKNALFHDGSRCTADDAAYSLRRAKEHRLSKVRSALSSVEAITANGDSMVVIRTQRANPILLNKLTSVFVMPRDHAERHSDRHLSENPVGTGPYRFAGRDPAGSAVLDKFGGYWGKAPVVERVVFISIRERDKRAQALLAGEVDLIRGVPAEDFGGIEGDQSNTIIFGPGLMVSYLGLDFSGGCPPLEKEPVRQAMYLGIDTERIVRDILNGYGRTASQLVPPGIFGFNPDIVRPTCDTAKARMLLVAAGYPQGFSVVLDIPENARAVGEAVASDLGGIGIDVRLCCAPWKDFYGKISKGRSALYFVGWDCTGGDASDLFDACLHSPDPEKGYGGANLGRYSDKTIDEMVERSGQMLDPRERQACLQEIMKLAMERLPLIPLYMQDTHYGGRREIEWEPRLDERIYVSDIKFHERVYPIFGK